MECFTKICVCLFFVMVTIHGVTAALLGTCADNTTCTAHNGDPKAVCSKDTTMGGDADGNCICTGAYKNNENNESCVAKVITDNDCTSNDAGKTKCQGVDQNTVCSASPTKCACKPDYFLSSDKTKCVQKISTVGCTPGATGTAECQKIDANSKCKTSGSTCTCKDGFKGSDFCTKVLAGSCSGAGDCTTPVPNSVCSAGKCECKANFIEESAICKGVITDTTCPSSNGGAKTCHDIDSNAECPTGGTHCACKADYFLNSTKTTCVKKITTVGCTPGTTGTAACKLVDPNSDCPADGDKCACKTGYAGTDSCTKDAGSSAMSAWMTSNVSVISLLLYLPRFMLW